MKKIIVVEVAILGLATITNAQSQKGFSVSVKGTQCATWMNNKTDMDNSVSGFNPMNGTSFGIDARYNFNKNIGIELDAMYSMQCRRINTASLEHKQKVNYVKVAPMFTYTIPTISFVSFVGKVVPQLSTLTDSKITDDDGNSVKKDTNEQYEDVTFGAVANIGAQFQLNKNIFLTTGLRYDIDFTNAENKNHSLYPTDRKTTTNSSADLEVGLIILMDEKREVINLLKI